MLITLSLPDPLTSQSLSATISESSPPRSFILVLPAHRPIFEFSVSKNRQIGSCSSTWVSQVVCVAEDDADVTVAVKTLGSFNYTVLFALVHQELNLEGPLEVHASPFRPALAWFDAEEDVIAESRSYLLKATSDSLSAMRVTFEMSTCMRAQQIGVTDAEETSQIVSQKGLLSVDNYSQPKLAAGRYFVSVEVIPQSEEECLLVKHANLTLAVSLSPVQYVGPLMALIGVTLGAAIAYIIGWLINYMYLKMDDVSTFYFIQKNHKQELVIVGDGFFAFKKIEENVITGNDSVVQRISTSEATLETRRNVKSLSEEDLTKMEAEAKAAPQTHGTKEVEARYSDDGGLKITTTSEATVDPDTSKRNSIKAMTAPVEAFAEKLDQKIGDIVEMSERESAPTAENPEAVFAPKEGIEPTPSTGESTQTAFDPTRGGRIIPPRPAESPEEGGVTQRKGKGGTIHSLPDLRDAPAPSDKEEIRFRYMTADRSMQVVKRKMATGAVSWTENLTLDQLDTRGYDDISKMSYQYLGTALTIALFYGILAIQISVQAQVQFNDGVNDQCAYNFFCANRYLAIRTFNNLMSNLSFLILGGLLLGITFFLSRLYWLQRCFAFRLLTGREGTVKEVRDSSKTRSFLLNRELIFFPLFFLLLLSFYFPSIFLLFSYFSSIFLLA